MPVKQRVHKSRPHRITPEAVAAFRDAMATRETYYSCVRSERCEAPNRGERCDTCRRRLDASSAMRHALGLRPWQPTPIDADTDEPPPARGAVDLYVAAWPLARRLRLELQAVKE
jgi:hypothetical protein